MINKYFLILKNVNKLFVNKLEFYFRNFNYTIIPQNNILSFVKDTSHHLIFFNNNNLPFKNIETNINNLNVNFAYLNNNKDIFYVAANTYVINCQTELCVEFNFENNINNYFDDTDNYNGIDHENFRESYEYFPILYKLYNYENANFEIPIHNQNLRGFFNKTTPIKSLNTFIESEKLDNFYHIVIFLNNKNINILNELDTIKYKNIRISIFLNNNDIDHEIIIKSKLHSFYKKNINFFNLCNFFNILSLLLHFENIIFINNFVNIDFDTLNNQLQFYKIIINNNYLCLPSSIYAEIPLLNNLNKITNLNNLKKYNFDNFDVSSFLNTKVSDAEFMNINYIHLIYCHIFNYYKNDIYIDPLIRTSFIDKKKIKDKLKKYCTAITYNNKLLIPPNYKLIETNLFEIKNYNRLLEIINKHIEKNYNSKILGELQVKKITTAILTNQEQVINRELLNVFSFINNKNSLIDIEILLYNTKFDDFKKDILVKLLNHVDDNEQIYNYYLKKTLIFNHQKVNFKNILKSINKNIKYISNKDKDNYVILLLKQIISLHDDNEIIEELNNIMVNLYDFNDIKNFDNLLKLNNILEDNKIIIVNFLMIMATHFNPYYKNHDAFIKSRETIKNNLIYLKNKIDIKIKLDQITFFSVGNFHLSYQGIPSVDIFKLKTEINRSICPELNIVPKWTLQPIDTTKPIKVLFHAEQLTRIHSVYKDRHQVIKSLSNDKRFKVYFSTFDKLHETVKYTFGNAKHIILPRKLSQIKRIILNHKFDIICYCEIGMYPLSYYMAHLKMAKKQCNIWGHSDTSGIDTVDYFFSSMLYELPYEESQTHYSEKLILQKSLCTSYVNPMEKYNITNFKNRYHYGFTDENIIYFCAQSLFKLNPIYDDYLIQILSNVPNSVLILSDSNDKYKVVERFNNMNVINRIHFFPGQSHFGYMNLMNISNVFLDVYPFGGCNSSFEGFTLNIPIVTQASQMINGRFTTGFYKKMGMENMVCNSKEEYINLAIKLGLNKEYRKEVSDIIANNKDCLFMDKETLDEWALDLIKISNNEI
jgi:predicted O-linked N-acetylglucosamine transferase (SPINDLY family)